jgi:hypothetical protein
VNSLWEEGRGPLTRWSLGSGNGKAMKRRCWLLICWRNAGQSASVLLVHKVVVLATTKALVHSAS